MPSYTEITTKVVSIIRSDRLKASKNYREIQRQLNFAITFSM